jgi:hypothetical protein
MPLVNSGENFQASDCFVIEIKQPNLSGKILVLKISTFLKNSYTMVDLSLGQNYILK